MDETLWRGIEKGISLFRNCDWKIKEIEEEKKKRMIIENEDEPQERERWRKERITTERNDVICV